MDIASVPNKIIDMAEQNATLLTFAGTSYARRAEIGSDDIIPDLLRYFTFQTNSNYWKSSPLAQLMGVASGNVIQNLTYKLWTAPHLNTQLFKFSAIAYIAGKYFGLIDGKWTNLAKKIATGAGLSAMLMPSSGGINDHMIPTSPSNGNNAGTNPTGGKIIGY